MLDIRGVYKHFKGGQYEVYGCCLSKKTSQVFVLYKSLYNDTDLWIRPYPMFFGSVNVDGECVERFKLVEKSNVALDNNHFYALNSETQKKTEIMKVNEQQFVINE